MLRKKVVLTLSSFPSDESFNPGESGSEVAEEYDTDAASSSSSSEEDSGEDEETRRQRKEARRLEKENERKAKTVVSIN